MIKEAAKRAKERKRLQEERRRENPHLTDDHLDLEPEEEIIKERVHQSERRELEIPKNEDDSEEMTHTGPKVQIDAHGNIVLDTESLIIQEKQIDYEQEYERVNESEGRRITSATYARHKRGDKWKDEEISLFYKGLRMFGCDFTMISLLFPTRTRREIRNKFKREEKENKLKIDHALKNRIPIDMELVMKLSKQKESLMKSKETEKDKTKTEQQTTETTKEETEIFTKEEPQEEEQRQIIEEEYVDDHTPFEEYEEFMHEDRFSEFRDRYEEEFDTRHSEIEESGGV